MKSISFFILWAVLVWVNGSLFGQESDRVPHLALVPSATHVLVSETVTIDLKLWMPPLDLTDDLKEQVPLLNAQVPHFEIPFLNPNWSHACLEKKNPKQNPPLVNSVRDPQAVFTLNDYASNDPFDQIQSAFSGLLGGSLSVRMGGGNRARFPFQTQRETRTGVTGWLFTATLGPYRAIKSGVVSFSACEAKIPLLVRLEHLRDRFGQVRYRPMYETRLLRTEPFQVTVTQPPLVGRPASFCGAIASNLTVRAKLDTDHCQTGDPLVLTVEISGAQNPSLLSPPSFREMLASNGLFRLDERSLETQTLPQMRRYSWRVRPLHAGTIEFPSLPVSYYQAATRTYCTCWTKALPVQVRAGRQAVLSQAEEAVEETYPLPDGLDMSDASWVHEPLFKHLHVTLVLFALGPLLFALARLVPPLLRRVTRARATRRRAHAYQRCVRQLRTGSLTQQARAIASFFSVRYGVCGEAVTSADARRLMADDFTSEEIEVLAQALAQHDKRTYGVTVLKSLALLFACVCCLGVDARTWAQARLTSSWVQATSEEDFKKVCLACKAVQEEGVANARFWTNWGACAFFAGDLVEARKLFSRAESWGGETPSTRRGLLAVQAREKNDPHAELSPLRAFFAPHFKYSLDHRLLACASVWFLGWLVALVPYRRMRNTLLLVLTLSGLSLALSCALSFAFL